MNKAQLPPERKIIKKKRKPNYRPFGVSLNDPVFFSFLLVFCFFKL